jgi:hypothetical protein
MSLANQWRVVWTLIGVAVLVFVYNLGWQEGRLYEIRWVNSLREHK